MAIEPDVAARDEILRICGQMPIGRHELFTAEFVSAAWPSTVPEDGPVMGGITTAAELRGLLLAMNGLPQDPPPPAGHTSIECLAANLGKQYEVKERPDLQMIEVHRISDRRKGVAHMTTYPVRCCCQPARIFGYLDLEDGLRGGDRRRVPVLLSERQRINELPVGERTIDAYTPEIWLRRFQDFLQGVDEIAVYSDDRPIEFWRSVIGFTELKSVMSFTTASLARDLAEEQERARRRFVHHTRPNRPLSMVEAGDLCRRVAGDPSQSFDAKRVAEQVHRVSHPSAMPVLLVFANDVLGNLGLARGLDSPFIARSEAEPATFMGFEIAMDPDLPPGSFDIYTEPNAAVERQIKIRRKMVARTGIEPARPPL